MLGRFRKAMQDKEEGFTLIELLVVMIIIGILAAIAIPLFLTQKKKAYATSAKSDLHQVIVNLQTALVDDPTSVLLTDVVTSGVAVATFTPTPAATVLTVGLSPNNDIDWIHSKAGSGGTTVGTTATAGLAIYANTAYCIAIQHAGDAASEWHMASNGATQTLAAGVC